MMRELLAAVLIVIGSLFSLIGVIGYLRLPDVYTRLHATGKVGIFGATFLLAAAALLFPASAGKCALAIFFIWIVGPILSSTIASVASASKTTSPIKK